MPLPLTLFVCKAVIWLSRHLGRGGGSALPGLIAERLTPDIAARLSRTLTDGVVIVTGTNGKTTTTKMLASVLESSGRRVLANRSGSNLSRGIVSTLVEHATLGGRLSADIGVFEVDEAAVPAVAAALRPRLVLVLNLFRDQLDRYGELDTTAALIGSALAAGHATVLLCADDPLVAGLSQTVSDPGRVVFFGVEAPAVARLAHDLAADSDHCPLCGAPLVYHHVFFGHMGHYACPTGHFTRPRPTVALTAFVPHDEAGSALTIQVNRRLSPSAVLPNPADGAEQPTPADADVVAFDLRLPGLYNAINALAALAAAAVLGVDLPAAAGALAEVEAAFGRVEQVTVDGRRLYLLLIKNPTGFNQVLQTFLAGKTGRRVLILINDNFADGRDVSWLWDVGFEDLAGSGARHRRGRHPRDRPRPAAQVRGHPRHGRGRPRTGTRTPGRRHAGGRDRLRATHLHGDARGPAIARPPPGAAGDMGMKPGLTIIHLYPVEMNIYGDRGNVTTLAKRLEWRGYAADIREVRVGETFDLRRADLVFAGGGQDRGQVAVGHDLAARGADVLRAADEGVVMLTICGTYQLFGRGFTTIEGERIPGIGLFGAETLGSRRRMIGNVVADGPFGRLVGFENHSGRTVLDPDQPSLARVVRGHGNDGDSGREGAVRGQVYGTYLHGPVLPKNPRFTDALLLAALARRHGIGELEPLDDSLERRAADVAAGRPQ